MNNAFDYDIIIIGARVAGSTLAAILGQKGVSCFDVLIVPLSPATHYQLISSELRRFRAFDQNRCSK